MNNIRIYAFFWMIVLLTVSCYEDKGNYDYHPINEVKISGIKEDPYEILRWDTLKIPVTLENSLNEKAKLIYAWYLDQKKIADQEGFLPLHFSGVALAQSPDSFPETVSDFHHTHAGGCY